MNSSTTSKPDGDPLSDVLSSLDIRSLRGTCLEAAGDWSLRFPAIPRLKFVAMLRGTCWILPPGQPPVSLAAGDTYLLGDTAFAIASDPALPPRDGMPLYAGQDIARLGGDDVVGIGGGLVLAPEGARFLLDALPSFMLIRAASPGAATIGALLRLLEDEAARRRPGEKLVAARLADILLIEGLRAYVEQRGPDGHGWIGALADRHIGVALRLMHGDVARAWTVGELAAAAGMSRSAFAQRFSARVGKAPLEYLRGWRMVLARRALKREGCAIGGLARRLGYASESAFGHAYKQVYGHSPRGRIPSPLLGEG
jgi:AraC-like DNA-binding protein